MLGDIPQFNWVKDGLSGTLTTTLSKASDSDVIRIEQRLHALGLKLELKEPAADKIVYEISKEGQTWKQDIDTNVCLKKSNA